MFHSTMAMRANREFWDMGEAEAKRIQEACAKAARHFPPMVTQKGADIGGLLFALGCAYIPRIMAEGEARRAERGRRPTTVQFPNGAAGVAQGPAYPPGLGETPPMQ